MTSAHGYVPYTHGCRCDVCREAARLYRRQQRARRLTSGEIVHGVRAAYDAGCRCYPCCAARSAALPRDRQTRAMRVALRASS